MNVSADNHVLTFAKDKLLCLLTWTESKKPTTSGRDGGSHIFACGLQSPCTCNEGLLGEWRHKVHLFLTSAMEGGELICFTPRPFYVGYMCVKLSVE